MNYKIPGLLAIMFLFVVLAIAAFRLIAFSVVIGIVYIIFVPVILLNLLYWYCRKCPHTADGTCRHVIFGMIAKRLFRAANPAKYSIKEIIFALLPMAVLVLFPQYWLFQNLILFAAFWILMLTAGLIVRTGVCKGCGNLNCALCPGAK